MANVKQVYQMMLEGKNAPEMLRELKIKPGRLKAILGSKMIWKIGLIQRDLVPEVTKMVALDTAMTIPRRLKELSTQDTELGRKACQSLLDNLNENFPPLARRMPKKGYWD